MNRKIKLIWDFFGSDHHEIAKHHAVHLKEYSEKNKVNNYGISADILNDSQSIAYYICDESDMFDLRDHLKPKRAQIEQT